MEFARELAKRKTASNGTKLKTINLRWLPRLGKSQMLCFERATVIF